MSLGNSILACTSQGLVVQFSTDPKMGTTRVIVGERGGATGLRSTRVIAATADESDMADTVVAAMNDLNGKLNELVRTIQRGPEAGRGTQPAVSIFERLGMRRPTHRDIHIDRRRGSPQWAISLKKMEMIVDTRASDILPLLVLWTEDGRVAYRVEWTDELARSDALEWYEKGYDGQGFWVLSIDRAIGQGIRGIIRC